MTKFAVTIKITKNDRVYVSQDYECILSALIAKQEFYGRHFKRIRDIYEVDKLGKVHYHGYWDLIKGKDAYYKAFNHSGCTCLIKQVYYDSGWMNYINKDRMESCIIPDYVENVNGSRPKADDDDSTATRNRVRSSRRGGITLSFND